MWNNFKRYIPEGAEGDRVLYLKSNSGVDWYESQKFFNVDTTKIMVDSDNVIIGASKDASLLFPENCSVYEVRNLNPEDIYTRKAYYIDKKIVYADEPNFRSLMVSRGIITLESEKNKARVIRNELFKKLDILDSKIAVGRIDLSIEEKNELNVWYNEWLNITNKYSNVHVSIESMYPKTPKIIEYFK